MIVVDWARMRHPINHDHGTDRLRRSVWSEARHRAAMLRIVSARLAGRLGSYPWRMAALSHFIRFVTASSSPRRILMTVNANPVHT